jgi:hypothetical protein
MARIQWGLKNTNECDISQRRIDNPAVENRRTRYSAYSVSCSLAVVADKEKVDIKKASLAPRMQGWLVDRNVKL